MAEDIPGDARLLTYAELGALLGIEPESAKRRAEALLGAVVAAA